MYAEIEAKIKALQVPKKDNSAMLQSILNSDWQTIYNAMNKVNKRTLWRNILKEIHVKPHFSVIFQ